MYMYTYVKILKKYLEFERERDGRNWKMKGR